METKVSAKHIRISPKKVRLVADLICGLGVSEALVRLQFTKKHAADPLVKLLKSAISNAQENNKLKESNLFIKEIRVDGGPTQKRWSPRAFGRATPIRKRTSHIKMILSEKVPTNDKGVMIKKEDKKDDLVKISDIRQIKVKDKDSEDRGKDTKSSETSDRPMSSRPQKGFVGKIFNRKSGSK